MNIDLALVPTLWYENEDGRRYFLSDAELRDCPKQPVGMEAEKPFIYQHSQFPNSLRHTVLKIVQRSEVDACGHPYEDIRRTYGWIDGIEGRECSFCHGSQTKKIDEPWPDEWDANGSREVASGNSTWPEDLVLAMASKSWWGIWRRHAYTLGEAILITANACERCLNALGQLYGMKWGYAEGSEEWLESNTRCQFCKTEEQGK